MSNELPSPQAQPNSPERPSHQRRLEISQREMKESFDKSAAWWKALSPEEKARVWAGPYWQRHGQGVSILGPEIRRKALGLENETITQS